MKIDHLLANLKIQGFKLWQNNCSLIVWKEHIRDIVPIDDGFRVIYHDEGNLTSWMEVKVIKVTYSAFETMKINVFCYERVDYLRNIKVEQ